MSIFKKMNLSNNIQHSYEKQQAEIAGKIKYLPADDGGLIFVSA